MSDSNQIKSQFSLEKLAEIVSQRSQSNDDKSYTRLLISKGIEHCSKKFGEESVELIMATIQGDKAQMVRESADVLYHLLVMLEASDVDIDEVMAELESRTRQSGLEEKASR